MSKNQVIASGIWVDTNFKAISLPLHFSQPLLGPMHPLIPNWNLVNLYFDKRNSNENVSVKCMSVTISDMLCCKEAYSL